MNYNKVGIIGGGPAGVFAALSVCEFYDADVTVFDFKKPLTTLLPTGGGRCNFSYFESDNVAFASHYPRGSKFMLSLLHRFNVHDTVDYFENIGIKSYVQNDNRIFPVSDSSEAVANIFLKRAELNGVKFIKDRVTDVKEIRNGFNVYAGDKQYTFNKIILSTGGKNHSLAKKLGHHIITPVPSLCPLKIKESEFYSLSGLTLKDVYAKIYYGGRKVNEVSGDMLFTENSLSGPLPFKISSLFAFEKLSDDNPLTVKFNAINASIEDLEKFTEALLTFHPNIMIKNAFVPFMSKNLFTVILGLLKLNPDKKVVHLRKEEKQKIFEALTGFEVKVTGYVKGKEIVTAGGVDTDEVSPQTMESKITPGLFFAGEILNTDGFTGGFNLQNCWSSARIAALNIFND